MSETASQLDRHREREEIYGALVTRAREGRMGKPLTVGDLQRGLLGRKGQEHALDLRAAMERAGVHLGEQDDANL